MTYDSLPPLITFSSFLNLSWIKNWKKKDSTKQETGNVKEQKANGGKRNNKEEREQENVKR